MRFRKYIMSRIVLLPLCLPVMAGAQEKGTHFEHGLTWAQVKEKAKKEHKFLLVDCFATWCGPCKNMAKHVFTQEKVGRFMNSNFVNVKVQFDSTNNDNDEVKRWRADARAIDAAFRINGYPTFLIFSPQGELVHRIVGGGDADYFLSRLQSTLNPETQYYTQLKKFENGKAGPELLKQLALVAKAEIYDAAMAEKLTDAYLDSQKDIYTKENLEFLATITGSSQGRGFKLFLKERDKVNVVLGPGKADEMLSNIIVREEIYPGLRTPAANIDSLIGIARSKYNTVDLQPATGLLKVQFYQQAGDWDKFQPAVLAYMEEYGSAVKSEMLNRFAWSVFENCDDPACIASALTWSKRCVEETGSKEPAFMDTYANLLYKTGKKDEAIALETKAMGLAPEQDRASYQLNVDKMRKGEKTWASPGGK